ncbi:MULTISPECIES: glycine betaine ABC transporter substrate-binding protein [Desulfococcus]|uniref:ABC-type glycine betaine transport, periplasmic subunit n=1 Tax=Desulfococcus multivorans DSM 2059 TaxID=1121405 RepID=S7V971_DESML|nr:glycine betaine ABC transporter substrate-binding protein [Desulfococcus multivorans]AOY58446.1 ABC-type glycine betaine/proline transport system, periplasmic glycine betaine/proline-binding protein [Desulfococcus multivorans]AQV00763.1 glycine/betaine ABC transporter substrate-binding protein [Desulfococcus multivorans]EPR43234.1 ABC-type glycine betaine transport, periplasmic subunit [Desulfococcus multivorans DSM 2059]MDX9817305.1 glycine betaine ABC transporter substrate-binding protein 
MKKMTWNLITALLIAAFTLTGTAFSQEKKIVVGAKNFTEQRVLGLIMIELLQKNGFTTEDKTGLGGTLVARKALENGQIDIYMEYTGTALVTMLKEKEVITDPQACYDFVKEADLERNGLVWLPMMPFNNTYCLMMRKDDAEKKGIKTLSDLSAYVKAHKNEINFGTNEEFYARPDGYKPLQKKYDFQFGRKNIKKMTPGLLYKALEGGQVDVAMGFATDGRIKGMGFVVLEDDKNYFPVYNPAPVVKKETFEKYPELETIFLPLTDKLDTAAMTEMNYQVDTEHKPVEDVAKAWLKTAGLL